MEPQIEVHSVKQQQYGTVVRVSKNPIRSFRSTIKKKFTEYSDGNEQERSEFQEIGEKFEEEHETHMCIILFHFLIFVVVVEISEDFLLGW